jgi:hypothetical protein
MLPSQTDEWTRNKLGKAEKVAWERKRGTGKRRKGISSGKVTSPLEMRRAD